MVRSIHRKWQPLQRAVQWTNYCSGLYKQQLLIRSSENLRESDKGSKTNIANA